MKLEGIMKTLEVTQKQAVQLNVQVTMLQHQDFAMKNYINKIKKLSLQSLDLFNEMHHQISLLNNESKSFDIREKAKQDRSSK